MSIEKIAIVTGANKGIGYAIVKGLCEKFTGKVYLTSRDVFKGEAAIESLQELGYNPAYHELDITNQTSVDKFKAYIAKNYGGVNVLVNNAGFAFSVKATEPFGKQAEVSVNVNYFGTLRVSEAFLPLLRQNANVINVSSSLGHLAKIPSEEIRKKIADPSLTISGLSDLMTEFVRAAKTDSNLEKTWGTSAYGVSKVGMSAMTIIHQRMLDNETSSRNIHVNHVHPGYVATNMNDYHGILTVEEGAVAPLHLALNTHGWKGQFVWRDCTVADWFGPKLPSVF